MSNDLATKRYGNCLVSSEEGRLYAIVWCLKLTMSVWGGLEVIFLYAEILGSVIPETGRLVSV